VKQEMDERVRIFLCALAGAVLFALLGGVFGAAAGAWQRAGDRASGGAIGIWVAQALERARRSPLPELTAAAVVGGVDGALFLGVLGCLFGGAVGLAGEAHTHLLFDVALRVVGLVATTLGFATIAHGLTRAGVRWFGVFFLVIILCGAVGGGVAGVVGVFVGALVGMALGAIGGFVVGPGRRE
jgi:hypothetical protein